MKRRFSVIVGVVLVIVSVLAILPGHGEATIQGLSGTNFSFTASTGHITTGEGNSVFIWGYGAGGALQYPGPTLIVNEGDEITITLTNQLPQPVSIVFPGQTEVQATGGTAGMLTQEAAPGGADTVTYRFIAEHPGTYMYHSGTSMDLQVEMGLFGALIVRPAGFDPGNPRAYGHASTAYDNEYLFVLSEMDHRTHQLVEFDRISEIDTSDYHPVYWFVNGRTFPDTILDPGTQWLPTQPYNSFVFMHPGDKTLLRVIGAGRDQHPFHTHGNNTLAIAQNGRLLTSNPNGNLNALYPEPDIARSEYTITSIPGETVDAIFEWTGKGLGWDIYGHAPGDPTELHEYLADHGKPFPVILPGQQALTFGGAYSGSPFLGSSDALPPDHVSINPFGALMFPWHSHHEKEIVNNDIFIGGMISILYIVPHNIAIPF
jgi:FtsP/CotA-like multicopper oxidase with cupredoxin domain